jgi:hypothetical protein
MLSDRTPSDKAWPHPLPPLRHRGGPLRGLLNPLLHRQPFPDLGSWRTIRDPQQRLDRALDELYAYYERTEAMFSNVLRDAELVDFARDAVAPLQAYLEEAAEVLRIGRQVRGRRRQLLGGALRHALAFSTWRSLESNGIGRSDAVKLMTALVEGAAAQRRGEAF